jgi:dihydrofolate reductase
MRQMTTGKLTATMFLTIDGVYQGPGAPHEDRDGGFEHGGWVVPYLDDDMIRIINDSFPRADAFLLGRRTYEIFASHWPRVTDEADPVASALNRLPKYVASRTLTRADWKGTTIVRDALQAMADVKRRHAREIQIHGSGALVRALLATDLVDELTLWHYPVVLGSGKRLFGPEVTPTAFELVDTARTGKGVVVSRYRRVGKPTYGTFGLETV